MSKQTQLNESPLSRTRYLALSITHYFESNGDLCQDPEMGVELVPMRTALVPPNRSLFQTAVPPLYQEVHQLGPSRRIASRSSN